MGVSSGWIGWGVGVGFAVEDELKAPNAGLTHLFRLLELLDYIGQLAKVDLGQGEHIAINYFTGEFTKIV